MPGHSTGAPQSRQQIQQTGHGRTNGFRQDRTISRDSTASQESYKEPYMEPYKEPYKEPYPNTGKREQKPGKHSRYTDARPSGRGGPSSRHLNGRGSETLGFIPGSADAPQGAQPCGSCGSIGWSDCRSLLCCVLTCGFYGSREPCLPANNETSTDHLGKVNQEQPRPPNGTAAHNPVGGVPLQPRQPSKLPPSDSFRYEDVHIRGQKVVNPTSSSGPRRPRPGVKGECQRPVSNTSTIYSREDLDLDELSDSKTDIDSLITRKLLELYALHQIDQLAKCTSDSSFSRKSNDISELICSIAHDYNLEQKEAECRLVHGVIRISTRKGKKNQNSQDAVHQRANGRSVGGTLPDSGNETMTFPFDSSELEPEVKVSELTSSDELARKMRDRSGRTYYSSSTTAYSPYQHDTENDSSGAPLLHVV